MRHLTLALVLLAPPALAQSGLDPAVMEACIASGQGRACIGQGAEACMRAMPGGASTIGHAHCQDQERGWWDDQLNLLYHQRMVEARRIDAEPGIPGLPRRPSDVDALRVMQRAWIAYRDATCTFEELQWWGGTGASGAWLACDARVTAEQVLYLRAQLGG